MISATICIIYTMTTRGRRACLTIQNTLGWPKLSITLTIGNKGGRRQRVTQRPSSLSKITILKGATYLVDMVVDDLTGENVEATNDEEVHVTDAVETGGEIYLATNVVRKGILLAIAGPKEVVIMVRETATWIPIPGQQTSPALMIRPYVVLLVVMRLAKEPCPKKPT